MDTFYPDTLRRLLKAGKLRTNMRILVLCGEQLDRDVFAGCGFRDVVISNVDERHEHAALAPFEWAYQQAESLTYEDNSFDVVAVHHGLHHCRQPHRALCEMYRVAREGVLIFEPCDNPLVRLGRFLKVGQEYEVHAVAANKLESGGVNNGPVPNFVHRWTAREIEHTMRAYTPEYRPSAWIDYHFELHWHDLKAKRSKVPLMLATLAWPFLRIALAIYPPLSNTLVAFVEKPGPLQPWLRRNESGEIKPDENWFRGYIK